MSLGVYGDFSITLYLMRRRLEVGTLGGANHFDLLSITAGWEMLSILQTANAATAASQHQRHDRLYSRNRNVLRCRRLGKVVVDRYPLRPTCGVGNFRDVTGARGGHKLAISRRRCTSNDTRRHRASRDNATPPMMRETTIICLAM